MLVYSSLLRVSFNYIEELNVGLVSFPSDECHPHGQALRVGTEDHSPNKRKTGRGIGVRAEDPDTHHVE